MEAVQEYVVGGLSHNQSEALNILNSLLEVAAPSKEALVQLSTIPSFSTNNSGSAIGDSHVAFIFLRAASKHMPVIVTEAVGSVHHDNGLKDLVNLVSNVRKIDCLFCLSRLSQVADNFFMVGSSREKQPHFISHGPSLRTPGFCQCFPSCTIDQFCVVRGIHSVCFVGGTVPICCKSYR